MAAQQKTLGHNALMPRASCTQNSPLGPTGWKVLYRTHRRYRRGRALLLSITAKKKKKKLRPQTHSLRRQRHKHKYIVWHQKKKKKRGREHVRLEYLATKKQQATGGTCPHSAATQTLARSLAQQAATQQAATNCHNTIGLKKNYLYSHRATPT